MDGWRDVNIVHNLEMLEIIGLAFSMLWDLNLSNKATKDFFSNKAKITEIWMSKVFIFSTEEGQSGFILLSWVHLIKYIFTYET